MLEYLIVLGSSFGIIGFVLYVYSLVMAIKGTKHKILFGLMMLFSTVLIGLAISLFLGFILGGIIAALLLAVGTFNLLKKRM